MGGVIFFPDMVAGLISMRRALAPGGRAIISAWGGPDETPAFTLIPSLARELFPSVTSSGKANSQRPNASPEFLRRIFEEAQFEAFDVSGPHSHDVVVDTAEGF